jgi:hypothetical protein
MRVIRRQTHVLEMKGDHRLRVSRLRAVQGRNRVLVDKAGSIKSYKLSLGRTIQGKMDQTRTCPAMRKRQERILLLEVIEIEIIQLPPITHKGRIPRRHQDRGHPFRLVMLYRFCIKTHRSVYSFGSLQNLQRPLVLADQNSQLYLRWAMRVKLYS